ncbi:CHAP domain-containing protein [Tritonibacter horizontis]|uniref:CHAP domain protein n=1 Tax=Tritonibacter horizontis TaxID=1768241 RepID=A0A132BYV5_9RHOB|nr:CHAP domain-containing protein [Tritonibacter horizontis]KUP92920.1 CHAP domain protein [Tritonibacter horizontis]
MLSGLMLCAVLGLTACGEMPNGNESAIDPHRRAFAVSEAQNLQARGARVWCVPFARNLSGVEIRGNAKTWWGKAQDEFQVSKTPTVGAVMAFSATSSMPLGHVAVVSELVSDRMMRVDHANWHRNKVSLGMNVIDVSAENDWSKVRLESNPGAYGSVYPITGFIRPNA